MANLTIMRARFPNANNGANLATPDPKETTVLSGTGGYIYLDMGESIAVDTWFFGFIGPTTTSIGAIYSTDAAWTGVTYVGDILSLGPSTARRRHAFGKAVSPTTSRYWRITYANSAASTLGIVAIGKSIQPAYGHEWGSRRGVRDMSEVTPLRGGGFGIERGARAGGYEFTCGDLTDAEVESLYDMVQEVGESSPVVVCRDPALTGADLNAALHYGLLDRPEAYAREAPGRNSWSFRVKDWV
mgnify:CR=1 FL=1